MALKAGPNDQAHLLELQALDTRIQQLDYRAKMLPQLAVIAGLESESSALRVETLAGLEMREMGYGWNLEMQMRAALTGLRIREIPVPYRNRIAGVSKVAGNVQGSLRAGSRIVQVLARVAVEARRERTRLAG